MAKTTILVVDDDRKIVDLVRTYLEKDGYRVLVAYDGLQALELAQAGELLAEDLRQAHHELGEITGEYSSDDLLGAIFSSFCIGK